MRLMVALSRGLMLGTLVFSSPLFAQEEVVVGETSDFIPLMEDKPFVHVIHEGRAVKIQRVQDLDYELKGYFAKTVRKCPPFCLRPMTISPDVVTIGEVEIFDFMENDLRDGNGILIDARTPSWFEKGTIPGSINVPFTELSKEPGDPALDEWLKRFGAKPRTQPGWFDGLLEKWGWTDTTYLTDRWDFSSAKKLALWCNGPTCGQSPRAISGLMAAGYPADKLLYYRGGMQMWQLFGLTTVIPTVTAVNQ